MTTEPDTNFNPVPFTAGPADGWYADRSGRGFRSAIVYTLRGCPNTGYPPSVPLAAVEFAAIDAAGDLWLAAGDKGTFRLNRAPSGG